MTQYQNNQKVIVLDPKNIISSLFEVEILILIGLMNPIISIFVPCRMCTSEFRLRNHHGYSRSHPVSIVIHWNKNEDPVLMRFVIKPEIS